MGRRSAGKSLRESAAARRPTTPECAHWPAISPHDKPRTERKDRADECRPTFFAVFQFCARFRSSRHVGRQGRSTTEPARTWTARPFAGRFVRTRPLPGDGAPESRCGGAAAFRARNVATWCARTPPYGCSYLGRLAPPDGAQKLVSIIERMQYARTGGLAGRAFIPSSPASQRVVPEASVRIRPSAQAGVV